MYNNRVHAAIWTLLLVPNITMNLFENDASKMRCISAQYFQFVPYDLEKNRDFFSNNPKLFFAVCVLKNRYPSMHLNKCKLYAFSIWLGDDQLPLYITVDSEFYMNIFFVIHL